MAPDPLNQLLAGQAAKLVHENFAGVAGQWWWERRIGGGIAICQTLDPEEMSREISETSGKPAAEVKDAIVRELGLDDFDPITLTFEVSGNLTADEAAKVFEARSSTPRGIASGAYREVEAALEKDGGE
ncbi:MAG: hypothetical protein M3494_10555 [Actinomycetota bacterium]|jgi:hypothetical protein|nr:hypothetical protein [Rubrobacter sp.]MDQ3508441.1 hypothetical protein [Actinomycetota bacterium]